MAQPGPADGIIQSGRLYKICSMKSGHAVSVDPETRSVVGNRYLGLDDQIWEAKAINGLWTFESASTGLYLGIPLGKAVKNGLVLTVSSHPFTWLVDRDASGRMRLFVPYTDHLLDLSASGSGDGITVFLWNDLNGKNQRWVVDPHLEYVPPLDSGSVYKLLSSNSHSVANLESSGQVSGAKYTGGENQKWEAVSSGRGTWYFKNLPTGLYLGIKDRVADKGVRVAGVHTPFAWDAWPRSENGYPAVGCRLYVPYTNFNLDLDDCSSAPGTAIHLWPKTDQYWVFEPVNPR